MSFFIPKLFQWITQHKDPFPIVLIMKLRHKKANGLTQLTIPVVSEAVSRMQTSWSRTKYSFIVTNILITQDSMFSLLKKTNALQLKLCQQKYLSPDCLQNVSKCGTIFFFKSQPNGSKWKIVLQAKVWLLCQFIRKSSISTR